MVPHFFHRVDAGLKSRPPRVDAYPALGGRKRGFTMTCPTCRSADLVEIGLKLHGELVTMHSCSVCESRWWDKGGERVSLPSVLELVATA